MMVLGAEQSSGGLTGERRLIRLAQGRLLDQTPYVNGPHSLSR